MIVRWGESVVDRRVQSVRAVLTRARSRAVLAVALDLVATGTALTLRMSKTEVDDDALFYAIVGEERHRSLSRHWHKSGGQRRHLRLP